MDVYKLVFTGPVGAGKTTAIGAISDIEPFTTEELATDETKRIKEHTTVAMDYGMMKLDNGERIHLYGTPGQERFDFMWEILTEGAIGLILLLNHVSPDPLGDMNFYLDVFKSFIEDTGVAIGVTRMEIGSGPTLGDYYENLARHQVMAPIFEVDARNANDVVTLTRALLYSLDPGVHSHIGEI